jgi:NitT/TauT family transport system substrate-binding protein
LILTIPRRVAAERPGKPQPRRFVWAMLAALLLLVQAGCQRGQLPPADSLKKVTIGVATWPASAALYVAREKGFFTDAGLDATLVPYASGHPALEGVLSGKVDLATAAETPIAAAVLEGKPVAIVATLAYVDRSIVVVGRKDQNIAVAGDLRGKRVGVTPGTAGDFFLHIYLMISYVDPADVSIVDLPAEELTAALAAGNVDAICTWAPYSTVAQDELGSSAVVLDEPGLYTTTWNLVVARDLLTRDPDVVTDVLRAIIRANEYIAAHTAEALAIVAPDVGMDTSTLQEQWPNYELTAELDQELILSLEDEARWLVSSNEASGTPPNFLDYIDIDSLRAIQPEAIRIIGR